MSSITKADLVEYLIAFLILVTMLWASCGAAPHKKTKKPLPPPKKVKVLSPTRDRLGEDRLGRDELGEDRLGKPKL